MKILVAILLIPFSVVALAIDIEQIQNVTQQIDRAVLSPSENCDRCAAELDQETIHKSLVLSGETLDVLTGYVGGDNYTIALKRTADTPDKVKLKIEYGERVCAQIVATQNPLNGQLGLDCLFHKTEKRSKTIHLDFSKASALIGDEHQSLRLVLHKTPDQKSIEHQLTITDGLFDQVNEARRFAGIFGHEYEIARRPGSRAPAVITEFDE